MARNIYPIASVFPKGVLAALLLEQLPDIWPADLFPVDLTINGPPNKAATVGSLVLETPRDITPEEDSWALDLFEAHDPDEYLEPIGTTIAQLPAPTRQNAGLALFVRDLDHATGPGVGTMAYSNGTAWRRMADDAAINIPA